VGGADGNPYLAAAAMLSAALEGIRQNLDPGQPVIGNAYDVEDTLPEAAKFSTTLADSAKALETSTVARSYLGDEFVEHFVMSRHWEVREYQRSLNSWQLERYFEII
jgi:glutamine synthetase